jgi:hypothetical protein
VLEVVTVNSRADLRKLEDMYMDIYHTREPGGWNTRRAFLTSAQKIKKIREYCATHKAVANARAKAWNANSKARANEMARARRAAKRLKAAHFTMRYLFKPCMIYPGFVME